MTYDVMQQDISEFMREMPSHEFTPFAWFDKHLDCIRVEIRDCSVTERRLNRHFTIYVANHTHNNQIEYVGFSIKGVRHLLQQFGLRERSAIKLAELIDKIVQVFPDAGSRKIEEEFLPLMTRNDFEVTIDMAVSH